MTRKPHEHEWVYMEKTVTRDRFAVKTLTENGGRSVITLSANSLTGGCSSQVAITCTGCDDKIENYELDRESQWQLHAHGCWACAIQEKGSTANGQQGNQ